MNMSLKSQTEHDSPSDFYFGRCAFLEEVVTLNLVTFRYVLYRKVKRNQTRHFAADLCFVSCCTFLLLLYNLA